MYFVWKNNNASNTWFFVKIAFALSINVNKNIKVI